MRIPRPPSELRKYKHIRGGMGIFNLTPILRAREITAYRDLSQDHYDNAIPDKLIRHLEYKRGLISREAFTKIESRDTNSTDAAPNDPIKNKNNAKSKRIMVVDDEQDVTYLFKLILEGGHHGVTFSCTVDTFNDPLVALKRYRQGSYDLILIDIVMPKLDGFKLYEELRKKDTNVKVCFLTAGDLYHEQYREQVHLGVSTDKIIRKPISNDELVRRISVSNFCCMKLIQR